MAPVIDSHSDPVWKFDFHARSVFKSLTIKLESNAPLIGIIGCSGAGKSSFLQLLLGFTNDWQIHGTAQCGPFVLFDTNANVFRKPAERPFAWVPQQGRLLPHMTVLENLCFGTDRYKTADHAEFQELTEHLRLAELLERTPTSLSGGERQRVAIGRAWLSQGVFAMFDEPLSSIDQEHRQQIIEHLSQHMQKRFRQSIMVSHNLNELKSLDADIWIFEDGELRRH